MSKRLLAIGGVVVLAAIALALFFVFRTPQEASAPIAAIPLATAAPAEAAAPTAEAAAPTAEAAAPTAEAAAPTAEAAAPTAEAAPAGVARVFEIVPAESEARFLIDEVLRGAPVTVVGVTDQVAGQLAIDVSNPAATQVGVIQVNARTLATDNDFRNRAIKNAILTTDSFEFITFTPTGISGIPATVSVGTPFTFQITGDLTVRDTTRPVTFEVTVTPESETQLRGSATTEVLYSDFGLNIPDSPAVDTVADQVRLELDFVALAVTG